MHREVRWDILNYLHLQTQPFLLLIFMSVGILLVYLLQGVTVNLGPVRTQIITQHWSDFFMGILSSGLSSQLDLTYDSETVLQLIQMSAGLV